MTPQLLEVDARRRISLGSLATHDRYLATREEDGTIVLTPAVVMPVAVAAKIDEFLADPSTGVHRSRPK